MKYSIAVLLSWITLGVCELGLKVAWALWPMGAAGMDSKLCNSPLDSSLAIIYLAANKVGCLR